MKFGGKRSKTSQFEDDPNSGVCAANYVERAKAFMAGRDGGFVIHPPGHPKATPAHWKAWVEYFEAMGIKVVFAKAAAEWTVPSEWPEQFDPSAPSSDPGWAPRSYDQVERTPEEMRSMRKRVAALYRELGIDLGLPVETVAPRRAPVDLSAPLAPSAAIARRMGRHAWEEPKEGAFR